MQLFRTIADAAIVGVFVGITWGMLRGYYLVGSRAPRLRSSRDDDRKRG
jgi:hypothetical protein